MPRHQFSLKALLVVVTLAGAWSFICRLALLVVTDSPVEFRTNLRVATVLYLLLPPVGAAIWFLAARMKGRQDWCQRVAQASLAALGMMLIGNGVLAGLYVAEMMMALRNFEQYSAELDADLTGSKKSARNSPPTPSAVARERDVARELDGSD